MPHTCNFSLPSAKTCSLLKGEGVERKKKNLKEEEEEGGREILINLLLDLGKVIWKRGVMFQGKLPIKYCKKIK